jgi:hypothetical protein
MISKEEIERAFRCNIGKKCKSCNVGKYVGLNIYGNALILCDNCGKNLKRVN